VGLHLRTETEDEAPTRIRLQVPSDVGHGHRIPRKRDGDAGAQFDPRSVFGGKHERQEGIVVDLGGPAAVVAPTFQCARRARHVCKLAGNGAVDLEAGVATHDRGRYRKQFSMVNVNMSVRRSPFDDRKCA
jgi:hypothetical protein